MRTVDHEKPTVVLIPGLWMPAWVMIPLAWRLSRAGLRCVRFGYASNRASLETNSARLAAFVRALGKARIHLVGHSLGGVLALHATAVHRLGEVRRIVPIGSPCRDTFAARKLARRAPGRWMVGKTVLDWLACEKPAAPPGVEVGVIAGTLGIGLGVLIAPDMPRPHDGVIAAVETPVTGMVAYVEVEETHAGMLVSARVARLAGAFLRSGQFDTAAEQGPAAPAGDYAADRRRSP